MPYISKEHSTDSCAFQVLNSNPSIPVIAHIPHSSSYIPQQLKQTFCISDQELEEEQVCLVDWYTDELFSLVSKLGGASLKFNISRFVVDPERYSDDAQEIMAQQGMGVIYTHGTNLQQIRQPISQESRSYLLDTYYRPHHDMLTLLTDRCLANFGKCLILDCHSYPATPLPYELFGDSPRPELCIGTDPIHTPQELINTLEETCRVFKRSCALNTPFKGTLLPLKHYGNSSVTSVMFEINRGCYLVPNTHQRTSNYESCRSWIDAMVKAIIEAF